MQTYCGCVEEFRSEGNYGINPALFISFNMLSSFKALRCLDISYCKVSDISVLSVLSSNLVSLELYRCEILGNQECVEVLSSLTALTELNLEKVTGVWTDLSLISSLTNLKDLMVDGEHTALPLSALSTLSGLERITLYNIDCDNDGNLSCLAHLKQLRSIGIYGAMLLLLSQHCHASLSLILNVVTISRGTYQF
jgi:hypothetical protein